MARRKECAGYIQLEWDVRIFSHEESHRVCPFRVRRYLQWVTRSALLPFSQRETGSLSEVAERAEYILLRDSKYKFHAPAWR